MTVAFTAQTSIDRPSSEVWDALVDWDNAHQWMGDIEWLRAEGPTQAGTELTFRARGKERPSTIAEVVPGQSITLRSVQGGVTADYHYRIEPTDEATTRVELTATCITKGAWRILGPIVRAAMRRADKSQLEGLKHHIETPKP